MANSPQAIKRARQAEKSRLRNASQKSAMRTSIKKVLIALKSEGKAAAQALLKPAFTQIDRLAGKNLMHRNKAARLKSRLNKKVMIAE